MASLVAAAAERPGCTRSPATGGGGAMGGWPRLGKAPAPAPAPRLLLLALALCCLLAQPQPSRAFFFGVRTSAHVPQRGGGREEKVPMTVVVPDYSPRPAPLGPAPAPVPVSGWDGSGGDDEDGTPRLPSERRSTGAPSSIHHSASAQAPGGATSADFISSSPAVPLPAGVTDSATVLSMPTPGQQLRDDVGMGTLQLQVRAVQLAVPLLMMLSFWG
ncbi:unnamed protein product [Miscanthus lutarioriparius]|uniref:Uncharacterized protein n=1 Tax=Miscanthus lutarioriparius TaxID=422564 RepID=A0A811R2D0_9POAL|nr:unnamed protein product [Miscanthus lutarioriparius]